MNILYVTGNYESVQKHLAEAFMRSGNDIKVFYYRIRNKKEKPDLLEHVLYYNSPFHMRGPVLLLFRLKAAALWCAKRMEKKPDILHGNMCFLDGCICRYLSHIWHVPYVLSVRDTDMNSSYLWAVPWLRRAGIRNLEQAKRILFLSEGYREMLLERLPKAAGDKIKAKSGVIPNGIDPYFLNHRYVRRTAPEQIRIIFVGKIGKRKNLELTTEAVRILRKRGMQVSLTAVGEIEDDAYRDMIHDHAFITYIPKCPMEDVAAHMRAADLFVMPSHTESFGLVYAEAMSQGLPVIYTRGQGFDRQFPDGTVGYAVSDTDSAELAEKILLAMEHYTERSNRCTELAGIFDWDRIANEILKTYRE